MLISSILIAESEEKGIVFNKVLTRLSVSVVENRLRGFRLVFHKFDSTLSASL